MNVTGDAKSVNSVFVPIHLKDVHWGIVIARWFFGPRSALQYMATSYFRDSYGCKCPDNLVTFFQNAFEYIVLGEKALAKVQNKTSC